MKIEDYNLIPNNSKIYFNGSRWKSTKSGEFTIIGHTDRYSIDRGSKKRNFYLCQFDDGYLKESTPDLIKKGKIYNPFAPTILGIGCHGIGKWKGYNGNKATKEYSLYYGMLERCYDTKCTTYDSYGGSGVTVCDRWKNFQNFCEDIQSLPNYDKWINQVNEKWEIDKDFLCRYYNIYPKIYSPYTCIFIPKSVNIAEVNKRKNTIGKPILATDPNGCNYVIADNINLFAKEHNLHASDIGKCLYNRYPHHKNWHFHFMTDEEKELYKYEINNFYDSEIDAMFLKYLDIKEIEKNLSDEELAKKLEELG